MINKYGVCNWVCSLHNLQSLPSPPIKTPDALCCVHHVSSMAIEKVGSIFSEEFQVIVVDNQ
jgi:hypothetical protein